MSEMPGPFKCTFLTDMMSNRGVMVSISIMLQHVNNILGAGLGSNISMHSSCHKPIGSLQSNQRLLCMVSMVISLFITITQLPALGIAYSSSPSPNSLL